MADSPTLSLDSNVIAEIADRLSNAIVERVIEAVRAEVNVRPTPAAPEWLDAREVAERLGVRREWVYEHADDLGASRIGSGRRPRLRFPPQVLEARVDKRTPAEEARRPAQRRAKPDGLIPIHFS
jgi:hypothetical protein